MQNVIQKFALGFTLFTLPLVSFATNKEVNTLQNLVPKDAKTLINKTKEISVAEANATNFTGTYTGKRYQYTADHTQILRTYTYSMQIEQKGDQITGTTNITADNGDYAVIKLRGIVISSKLYFEEYQIEEQKKSDDMVWCFKVGELQLGKNKGNTVVYGPTNSYTSINYYPCTGGYTVLEKETTLKPASSNKESNQLSNVTDHSDLNIIIYPNPFVNNITAQYNLTKDAKVTVELFDINGKLISTICNESQTSGDHNLQIDGSKLSNGVYVLKLNVDGQITSKQIIKSASN